jgi:N-acetylmuramoyl-L-alanine amidase
MFTKTLVRIICSIALLVHAATAAPLVVIDAGHGGHDRGGMPNQYYAEKEYALDVAKRLEAALRKAGFRTAMTRTGDYFVTLQDRAAIANRYRSNAVFVSIHFNGAPNPDAHGIETYYHSGKMSAALARSIHAQVLRATGEEDRRVRSRGFSVLRNTRMPAVLCELGFLTNRDESRKIRSSSYRQRLADAVAAGIRNAIAYR